MTALFPTAAYATQPWVTSQASSPNVTGGEHLPSLVRRGLFHGEGCTFRTDGLDHIGKEAPVSPRVLTIWSLFTGFVAPPVVLSSSRHGIRLCTTKRWIL